jgi:hypothetical protein
MADTSRPLDVDDQATQQLLRIAPAQSVEPATSTTESVGRGTCRPPARPPPVLAVISTCPGDGPGTRLGLDGEGAADGVQPVARVRKPVAGKDGVRVAAGTGLVHDKFQPVPVGQGHGYRGAVTGVLAGVLQEPPLDCQGRDVGQPGLPSEGCGYDGRRGLTLPSPDGMAEAALVTRPRSSESS